MICLETVKKYCKNYTEIENYNEAVADTQTWDCHHKLENLGFTRNQLIKMGMYYNVIPRELIFLTKAEHIRLHRKGKSTSPKRYIRCIETSEIHYDREWRKLGYGHAHDVASGIRYKSCKGLHFEYVD